MSGWSPLASAVGLVLSGLIMVVAALIGANMLLLLCSAWLLAYAGVFFLGFGGSRWTSDIAINYYKKILEVGASLFTMILLLGVGQSFIDAYYSKMNQGQDVEFADMGVMLVVAIILLFLVEKVPPLVCGIVTGASYRTCRYREFRGRCGYWRGAGLAVGAAGMAGGMASRRGKVHCWRSECIDGGLQVRATEYVESWKYGYGWRWSGRLWGWHGWWAKSAGNGVW